ncbi:MAG: histidine phosphatase family protein [Calditrichaeota bacterium]|nr:histidine phosphatase family protein [Calditrichota bacterium]
MKKVYIMRHAKSSWDHPNLSDYERPLNNRGLADAPMMGEIFKKLDIKPELIISSSAKRAITTARIVAEKMGYPPDKIMQEKKIYTEADKGILKIINRVDNRLQSVMIVGHNPILTSLVNKLSDYGLSNLPTAAMAAIEFDVDVWQAIAPGVGKVVYFEYPKKYK